MSKKYRGTCYFSGNPCPHNFDCVTQVKEQMDDPVDISLCPSYKRVLESIKRHQEDQNG